MIKFARWILLLLCFPAAGQPTDTPGTHDTLTQAVGFSKEGSSEWSPLYNGRQFYGYPANILGDPFYPEDKWNPGTIHFDGTVYHGISILYDAYKDEVIVRHPSGVAIILFGERVPVVSFAGYNFVYMNDTIATKMRRGFYQRRIAGKTELWIKRGRILEEKITDIEVVRRFLVSDKYYMLKEGKFYPIVRKNDIFDILKEKRRELVAKKDRLRMKYRKDPENFIITLVEYYNQLTR